MSGSPLTLEERYLIQSGLVAHLPFAVIGRQLGRHRSVIYDEYHRGCDATGKYCPHRAQKHRNQASARSASNAPCKPPEQWQQIRQLLKQGWSPEQISGRRTVLEHPVPVSFQAIYLAAARNHWRHWLRRTKLRSVLLRPARRPYSGTAQPIHQRDSSALSRLQMGHWEADTAIGKKRDIQRLLVMNERQSLYMQLSLLRRVQAQLTARTMKRRLDNCGVPFESVTTDRGPEFAATGAVMVGKAFVCDPHAPNQRGTNENQIGMLRLHFPKGVSMDNLTPAKVRRIQNMYNHRPRKCLGFLTPHEVAFDCPPLVGTRS